MPYSHGVPSSVHGSPVTGRDDKPSPSPAGTGPPAPVLPDYSGACLSNLVPALLGADRPSWIPEPLRSADQVVLLVVDGLGWEQLRTRVELAPTMATAAGFDTPITSVAPTTTACALTSITTGQPPASHGMLGYRLATEDGRVLNTLRWVVGTGREQDARVHCPAARVQRCAPFPGALRPVPVVSHAEFGVTGFTAAHLGDAPLYGYRTPSGIPVEIRQLVAEGEPFVYAYYDGVDKVAHAHGLGAHFDAELVAADRLVADIVKVLPSGAVLAVTADHGQVEVGPRVEVLGRAVMAGVRFLSGEGRFRWLHAVPGATDDLVDAAGALHASTTWVRRRDQIVDEGWLGGSLDAELLGRLGDVVLAPYEPIAFLDPADTGETRLAGRHGSLTSAEMLVPLLALRRDDNIEP